MERRSYCVNGISKIGRILDRFTKKLGRSDQSDGKDLRSNKKTIWQKEAEPTRITRRRRHMVRSQEYSFEQTLEEARPEKIWTF